MKTNMQSMRERIKHAPDMEALRKVEESLERLYNNGIFTAKQLLELDHEMTHRSNVMRGYASIRASRNAWTRL